MKRLLTAILVLLGLNLLFAFELPYSSTPVITDSNLLENFVRISPDDQQTEKLPTKAWLWYDENALYISFEAAIDSTFISGLYAPRDSGTDSDYLRVQIITIPEAYYAYYYIVSPSAKLYDGIRKYEAGLDKNWNSEYSYETSINDSIWTVDIRFPFKDMRFGAKPPYNWKIILTRYHKKTDETFSTPYVVNKMDKEYFTNGQDIRLTHQIKRNSDWKFKPYYVKSYDLIDKTDTFDPEHVGLDISYNPSTRTKLKASFNPDFSDVPPDDAQDNYNSKYPPWYLENRYFFTEDIEAFGVDYSVFYTRNIVQPQFALKYTGNSKTWNYGYLCAQDKKITDNGSLINNDDFFQLASVIKTLPRFKAIVSGFGRMNDGYYNHMVSGYWNWEFIKELHVGSSFLYSIRHKDNPDPGDKADYQGNLTKAFVSADPGNWYMEACYINVQKDLKVDTGTIWDTGYEDYSYNMDWNSDPSDKYLKSWGFNVGSEYADYLDAHKSLFSASTWGSARFDFKPKYTLSLSADANRESWQNKEFDTWGSTLTGNYYKWDNLGFYASCTLGRSLVYSLNETYLKLSPGITITQRIGKSLSWSVLFNHKQYDYNEVNYIYTPTDTLVVNLDNSYQIANASLIYNFSNQMTSTTGLGVSTYKSGSRYSNLTFYSNFRYEFKKDWFLYLGYKTGQSQDEPSTTNDFVGHFNRNSASAYLKLSLTI
jgi:hypothetical protein